MFQIYGCFNWFNLVELHKNSNALKFGQLVFYSLNDQCYHRFLIKLKQKCFNMETQPKPL